MPNEVVQLIDLDDLRLDDENPRLPESIARDQKEMLTYIARTSSIAELMTAIGQHGYFLGEPLIVVPSGSKYVVVEGNRRVTALKLLQNPTAAGKNNAIQTAAAGADEAPTKIPCIVFSSRDQIINYLGYRHITGIKQWEPLAKARYVANYFETQTSKRLSPEKRYRAVARSIGSQGPFIKRQLDGMAIYRALEKNDFYGIEGLDEENIAFSLLTTCLGYDSILRFVSSTNHPFLEPKKLKTARVKELTRWLFERDDHGETRLGDSRNIQRLALIVDSPEALADFRAGATMDEAYGKTRGIDDEFADILSDIAQHLSRALSMAALVDMAETHVQQVERIKKQVAALEKVSRV